MDKRTKSTIALYAELSAKDKYKTHQKAGRPSIQNGQNEVIVKEIFSKLDLKKDEKVLDLGCGAGDIVSLIVEQCISQGVKLYLLDFAEVIDSLPCEISKKNVVLSKGVFPYDYNQKIIKKNSFDKIILYSVLHYTNKPEQFINAAFDLLAPGGKLLIGDYANVEKKGRFLSTSFGHEIEAAYRNVPSKKLPRLKSVADFIKKVKDTHNTKINDKLLIKIFKNFRMAGHEVYILEQSKKLPYSLTREDLLIVKKHK